MEDLLGMPLPLYYRLILMEEGVKRNSLPLFGDCIQGFLPSPAGNYLRTAPKKRGEKRKITLISIYNIGKVENPLDFRPSIDITFVRDVGFWGSARGLKPEVHYSSCVRPSSRSWTSST